jgi:hypothetical protein
MISFILSCRNSFKVYWNVVKGLFVEIRVYIPDGYQVLVDVASEFQDQQHNELFPGRGRLYTNLLVSIHKALPRAVSASITGYPAAAAAAGARVVS